MFINPRQAIREGWLKNVEEEHIQPNAIDIPFTKIYELNERTTFELYKTKKVHKQ